MKNTATNGLFALLRAALHGKMEDTALFARCDEACWGEIYRRSSVQGVLAVAWDGLQMLPGELRPPRALLLEWAFNVEQIEKRYRRHEAAVTCLAAFYHKHGFPMMLLKGYGLSLSYPVPSHRPFGDIDIWLYGRQPEADRVVARELGLRIDEDKEHHTTFLFDGIMVENHYDLVNNETHSSNRRIEQPLKRFAAQPGESVELGGVPVGLPSVPFNALFLLRHAAVHFAAVNIGLRHVLDWYVFIERNAGKIGWEELYALAREANMDRFLGCLNAICVEDLGLDPSLLPPFTVDPKLKERVLNEILSPEFSAPKPTGLLPNMWFKTRRWWANRWKHRIVYDEGLAGAFVNSVRVHLKRPKSISA